MSVKVSTKLDKNAKAQDTVLDITWDDSDAERALAQSALVVKIQARMRADGVIPERMAVKVSDYAPGVRHATVIDPLTAAKAMSPEERLAFIEKLKAMQ